MRNPAWSDKLYIVKEQGQKLPTYKEPEGGIRIRLGYVLEPLEIVKSSNEEGLTRTYLPVFYWYFLLTPTSWLDENGDAPDRTIVLRSRYKAVTIANVTQNYDLYLHWENGVFLWHPNMGQDSYPDRANYSDIIDNPNSGIVSVSTQTAFPPPNPPSTKIGKFKYKGWAKRRNYLVSTPYLYEWSNYNDNNAYAEYLINQSNVSYEQDYDFALTQTHAELMGSAWQAHGGYHIPNLEITYNFRTYDEGDEPVNQFKYQAVRFGVTGGLMQNEPFESDSGTYLIQLKGFDVAVIDRPQGATAEKVTNYKYTGDEELTPTQPFSFQYDAQEYEFVDIGDTLPSVLADC